ncbi:MAG: very short patch repair endonuclease, partial [Roseiarcus sp.]
LHRHDLPGRPDLTFGNLRKVIFVHGCFWHRHADSNCKLARLPKSRLEFWLPKLERNKIRDEENQAALAADGWSVLVVWECELKNIASFSGKIRAFLSQ